jgi:hypothetical protein
MSKTPIKIGFWRGYDSNTRSVITEPDYSSANRYEAQADTVSRGEHLSLYISDADLRRVGVQAEEAFLRLRAQEARERADQEFRLPVPEANTLDGGLVKRLVTWLGTGSVVNSYRGMSTCRLCGCMNGCAEQENSGYLYPSGLAHYVMEHRCAVPGLPDEVWR